MGVEKQSSEGGGVYTGAVLQLFDQNEEARKKLFSNKSDFPVTFSSQFGEGSKQVKRNDGSLLMVDEDDNGGSCFKGNGHYSYASSVMRNEGNGTKAPGVVAKLMGLDSLPTSNVSEPYSTLLFDFRSLQNCHYRRTPEFLSEPQIMYNCNQSTELDGYSRNPVESRHQKILNRPIERFQTKLLPSKLGKSIPITHHKLLSPIKSPGFIPTKNTARMMEEATKIIEPRSHAGTKDLKEKMEAVQRPPRIPEASQRSIESKAINYLKGRSLNKRWDGVEDAPQLKPSNSKEHTSIGSKNRGKSTSLAIQAKVNVKRREDLSLSSRSLQGQKERNVIRSNRPSKSQLNTQKNVQNKSSTYSVSSVLRQNNKRQNCLINRDKLPSKPMVPNQQSKKTLSRDASFGQNKSLIKVAGNAIVGSRKVGLDTSEIQSVVPLSRTKNCPRKKLSVEDFHFEKSGYVDSLLVDKGENRIHPNVVVDGYLKWEEHNRRKHLDVVSFTFTSPMIKSMPGSLSSCQVVEKHNNFFIGSQDKNIIADETNTTLTSLGFNAIRGDSLNVLFEHKLRELTCGVDSSYHHSVKSGSVSTSASIPQDLVSDLNAVSTTQRVLDNGSQLGPHKDKLSSKYDSYSFPTDGHKLQVAEEKYNYNSLNSESKKELHCQSQSLISRFSRADNTRSDEWELEYVREILCNAELMFKDFALGRAREIINPHLFDQLENRKTWLRIDSEEESRLRRKIIFDCVGECLDLRCRKYVGGGFRRWTKGMVMVQRKKWLVKEVFKEISGWRSMEEWMLDQLVDKDMRTQNGRWVEFEIEEFDVGVEIGRGILSSLVEEVVADILLV